MRTADLRILILKTVKEKEFYGYDIQKKMISEGIKIEIGRLYNVLNQMLRDGLLESRWETSAKGPKRKLYRLGIEGKKELDKILLTAIKTIHKAYGEYLLNLPPEKSVFNSISEAVVASEKSVYNLVLVVESSSPMYQRLLKSIQDRLVDLRIFIVKPKALSFKVEMDNVVNLEGNLENIPLKDNYVDLLLTTNMPRNQKMEKTTKEWRRVLKKTGTIALIAPTVLFASIQDPLTIGDFMEKWEHEIYESRKAGEGKALLECLHKNFSTVKERNIVHMKLIFANNVLKKEKY
ncbi:MAG: helix-turn-helix transcriptional regulator [Candidatus Bathyarchaeota archaeon]|nr:helix-turn-helix transcriptional regulator [Candidatus Bathyarchaeota archaeon]